MSLIKSYFSSEHQFKQAFSEGLAPILAHKTAGTFILVCANAFQHSELKSRYQNKLTDVFFLLKQQYEQADKGQFDCPDAPDDIGVMKQLISLDLSKLNLTETRFLGTIAGWQVTYNAIRSFRPSRMSSGTEFMLDTPFNPDAFHFNKEFLKKEIFAEGDWNNKTISVLYNKFPFVDYHGLLVIDKHKQMNQFLTEELLCYVAALQNQIQSGIGNIVIAYNSIGAGASVNHLHFQICLPSQGFALFSPAWQHNGGLSEYPAVCYTFDKPVDCWVFLRSLHEQNISYNLVFQLGKIYCLPRQQPATKTRFNSSSFGWYEMAGGFTCFDKTTYDDLSFAEVEQVISDVSFRSVINTD